MKRLITISILFLYLASPTFAQQQSLFSAFAFNKLTVNPAGSGLNDRASIFFSHRNQWSGLNGAPQSNLINYIDPGSSGTHTWAAQLMMDKLGIQDRYDISAFYSYGIQVGASHIRLGANVVNSRFSVDYSSPDILALDGFEADPAIDRSVFSSSTFDFGLGIYLEHKYVFGGFAINKIIGNKIKTGNPFINNSERRHINAMIGANIYINETWNYHPQLLLKLEENTPFNLDILNMFSYKDKMYLGLNIRSGGSQNVALESFDGLVAFQFTDKILAGINYEINATELKRVSNGSLDLFLQYRFEKKTSKDSMVDMHPELLAIDTEIDSLPTPVEKETETVEIISEESQIVDSLVFESQNELLSGGKISFNNILYEFDSYTILEGAAKELDDLGTLMLQNPEMKIQLSSYTDSRGSELYNLELSNKRALSAKNYLIDKGVNPQNIVAIGYGETSILNHCTEGVRCSDEEHNFNRRTEVQLIKE